LTDKSLILNSSLIIYSPFYQHRRVEQLFICDNYLLKTPVVDLLTDPVCLWPPNNKLVPVKIFGTVLDAGSGIRSIHIEVMDEYGTCQPVVTDIGTGEIVNGNWERTIQLEASRKGNDKDSRMYTIRVTATDNAGNVTTKEIIVIVPHDPGK
jgi:hypothetical protein